MIAIILTFYQNSTSLPPLGGLWEAVSEEDVGNSRQENILMMGQDTNVTATSQSDTTMQLAPRCTTLEENAIIRMQNLKKVNHYIHCLLIDYLSLVLTKSVDSNFFIFWLAPVTDNILGYSLFCDRSQDGVSLQDIFGSQNLSDKWSSPTNQYKEGDKLWLVSVYTGR